MRSRVRIRVAKDAEGKAARDVTVVPVADEEDLRYRVVAWGSSVGSLSRGLSLVVAGPCGWLTVTSAR